MGYCAGEGLPCPDGLTSRNGYTPCNCKFLIWIWFQLSQFYEFNPEHCKRFLLISVPVQLNAVSISTSVVYSVARGEDVVMLHCNPIIEGIRDPSTITVEIKWWISSEVQSDQKNIVFEESFRLSSKTFSTLERQHWRIGDTVSGFSSIMLFKEIWNVSDNLFRSKFASNTNMVIITKLQLF